jgi:uncharacterized membrane protein
MCRVTGTDSGDDEDRERHEDAGTPSEPPADGAAAHDGHEAQSEAAAPHGGKHETQGEAAAPHDGQDQNEAAAPHHDEPDTHDEAGREATASGNNTPTAHGEEHAAPHGGGSAVHGEALAERLARIEALLGPARGELAQAERRLVPAWRRATRGEPRWAATVGVLAVVGIQLALPARLGPRPQWLLPTVELLLLAALVVISPHRIERRSRTYRSTAVALTALLTATNVIALGHLVDGLVHGTEGKDAGPLLVLGGSIWLANVIAFALWYWEYDRGGPVARAVGEHDVPDFLFVQMQSPELAPPHWEPAFLDYFYLAFTNATAFSPTDVMPVTRWAKMLMLVQSAVSLVTVVLVVARAVNILK